MYLLLHLTWVICNIAESCQSNILLDWELYLKIELLYSYLFSIFKICNIFILNTPLLFWSEFLDTETTSKNKNNMDF